MYIFFCFNPCRNYISPYFSTSQQTNTCSMLTIEALEKDVKYVQVKVNDVVLVSLLLTLNIFHFFSI